MIYKYYLNKLLLFNYFFVLFILTRSPSTMVRTLGDAGRREELRQVQVAK